MAERPILVLGGSGWTSDPLANPVARASMTMMAPEFTKASMLFTDGADHDRLRGAVRDAFTRSTVAGLTEGVETIAAEVIAQAPTALFLAGIGDASQDRVIATIRKACRA